MIQVALITKWFCPLQVTARARDPEGGPVRYALVGGDDPDDPEGGHFSVEESTGVIRVRGRLDRETKRRYALVKRHSHQTYVVLHSA